MSDDDREYAAWGDDTEDEGTEIVASLEPGTFFADRFQVDGRLGMGAMGKVVTATDMRTGQRVALKVLHREKAAQREAAERFTREAEVLARLGHPGIVRVIGSERMPDGTRWLAMELIEGDTIAQRIRKKGPFTPEAAYEIISMLCDALDAAHREGIVHRDLKPENVMLPAGGTPSCKILDFGLARVTQIGVERLTRAGTILGTPRYMAPELIETLKDTDHRADVFAVAVITYELLTAKSIYAAEDVGQLFGAILEGRMRTLESLRPDLPASIGAVITRGAMRKPADRYQTAGAFAEAYAHAAGIAAHRSQLATDMFDDQTMTGAREARAPLVDPFAPSLARPAASITAPSVVAIAPVRMVSDRPKPMSVMPRVSVPSQNRTIGAGFLAASPPPSVQGTPISYGGPPVMPSVMPPSPAYIAPLPLVPTSDEPTMVNADPPNIPPEGQRPFSDRPPPFVGADQPAPSAFPQRQRSFTPPLGVSGDAQRPIAPPVMAPPAKSRTGLWIVLALVVVIAAIAAGVGLRFVIESGLLPH